MSDKKLKYARLVIGVIAIGMFFSNRLLGIDEWKWLLFVIGMLCFIGYQIPEGFLDAIGQSKIAVTISVVSLIFVLTAAIINLVTKGETRDLFTVSLWVFLGTMSWLRLKFRNHSKD